ncbi:PAS domain S-box-containing protein [Verrucomicrobium sp. GAS474]|uniref:ATP-binding protein n=1 Tax=Verrucomicrobium sp. GAS474 TaxID=1882831 RepID=UPI00087A8E0D|nr:ATP-binding protein [Verrucomicrobium sp. GAS474]SDU01042.1 PAS domain S-box-containing protein [Verrucomicrobium sp. GAS474]
MGSFSDTLRLFGTPREATPTSRLAFLFRFRFLPAVLVYLAFAGSEQFLYQAPLAPCGWAAYGVALAFFLLDGWAALPGLFVGVVLGLWNNPHPIPVPVDPRLVQAFLALLTLGLPGLSAVALRRRLDPIQFFLTRIGDLVPILLHSFLVAGAGSFLWLLFLLGCGWHMPPADLDTVRLFVLWFSQQSVGVILLTPVLLRHFSHPSPLGGLLRHARRRPFLLLEEIAIYAGVPMVSLVTLFNPWGSHLLASFYTFTLFAFLVWGAVRFGFRGASFFCLIRAVFTLVAAREGHFLFNGQILDQGISTTAYVSIITAISLCIGMIFEERRNLIVRLTESEARLQSLLRHSPLPITIKDLQGRYLLVNPAAELSFGHRVKSLIGRTDREIFHSGEPRPEAAEGDVAGIDALVLSTRRPLTVAETFTTRTGILHYSTTKFPLLDPHGVPHAVCSMSIDVTEQQRAERERDRFFTLVPDLFCVLRFDGRIVRANPSFLRYNNLTGEEATRSSIHDLADPSDLPLSRSHFHPAADSRIAEIRWRQLPGVPGGGEIERVLSWTVVADLHSELLFASGRDVSERKRDERTLLEAIETADRMAREAETANRSKTSFLAVMTHELRTPLNGILGAANLLETTEIDAEQTDYVRIMTNCGESLQRLVTDILDFAKSQAGRISMAEEPFDVRASLEEVVSTLSPTAAKKNIALFLVCPALPSPLLGDALRLRQVLLNLAGNGLKFSDRGRVIIRAMVENEEADRVRLRFEVEDSGPGIAKEAFPLLFKPFSQADDSPTRSHGGAGLGLAISKNLVELMEGEIGVRSEPGKGSLFSFTARFRKDLE